jgi:hypothetical protein
MSANLKVLSLEYQTFNPGIKRKRALLQYETLVGRHGSEQFMSSKLVVSPGVADQGSECEWNGVKVTKEQREANVLARTLRGKLKKRKNRDSKAATKLNEFKSSRQ